MAKAGMRRPSPYDPDNHGTENHHKMNHPKNEQAQVPEIQGAAKTGMPRQAPSTPPTGQGMIIRQAISTIKVSIICNGPEEETQCSSHNYFM